MIYLFWEKKILEAKRREVWNNRVAVREFWESNVVLL
jgi:hypothetical protein